MTEILIYRVLPKAWQSVNWRLLDYRQPENLAFIRKGIESVNWNLQN